MTDGVNAYKKNTDERAPISLAAEFGHDAKSSDNLTRASASNIRMLMQRHHCGWQHIVAMRKSWRLH
jgi:hypothetical protein